MAPEDPRSALIWEFVRLVKALRPSAFVLENVKALATLPRWTTVRSRLFGALVELGYDVQAHILNAQDFEVPQKRKRVFFIGTADGLSPVCHIRPTVDRPRTAGEVLRALPPPGMAPNLGPCRAKVVPARRPVLRQSPYAGLLFNGQGRPIDLASAVNTLPASMGGNKTPIVDEGELRNGLAPWAPEYHRRLLRGLPPLAKAPERLRRLTVTEAALLQGFPAGFRFEGSLSSQFRQVGNSVPPPLAEAVALALRG
jgi:DNA (cytosine-5)-methyltransferase 1